MSEESLGRMGGGWKHLGRDRVEEQLEGRKGVVVFIGCTLYNLPFLSSTTTILREARISPEI